MKLKQPPKVTKLTPQTDPLGLRTAMADRLLPVLVAAMSFLAALAIAGALAAATLASAWSHDTGTDLTVQVPEPADTAQGPNQATSQTSGQATSQARLQAVLDILSKTAGVSAPHLLSAPEITALLKPWLGDDAGALGLPVPAVINAHWQGSGPPDALRAALAQVAPGTLAETGASWAARVTALTTSLQDCALAVLLIVALVATAMVAVATRAGLAQRRDEIEIIHGLGALDADIARSFARRATFLTVLGALLGTFLAVPMLITLAALAAPFAGAAPRTAWLALPPALWLLLPVIPLLAALIGGTTTQLTVRGWLRRL